MSHTADQYREQLKALLPPGLAFTRQSGTTLHSLLDALAQEFARVDSRGDDLLVEAIPSTTTEMLEDWERVAGLPDPCVADADQSIDVRRAALVSKLIGTGGASIAYFLSVAEALGYQITITEFRPFRVGESSVGEPLYDTDWHFAWQINYTAVDVSYFRVGHNAVGERLATWGDPLLECRMNALKPAHTVLIFAYGTSELMLQDGSLLLLQSGEPLLFINP